MVGFKKITFLMAAMTMVTACQKAKMTSIRPTPPAYTGSVPPAQPEPLAPELPLPLPYEEEEEELPGPDPVLEPYQPSEPTPIEDDGLPVDPNIFSPNQQSGIEPDVKEPNIVEWLENSYVRPVLSKCGDDCPPVKVKPPKPKPVPKPKRNYCAPIQLDKNPITKKIDILFVVDTSASLKEERTKIVAQMGSFIDKLRKDVDYQIGVLPAHGPSTDKSPNNFFGELYSSGNLDPLVITLNSQNRSAVVEVLKEKMASIPSDKSSAQGEVGLLSLYKAVTSKRLVDQRFLRPDAALAVIFIADEQDACYDYERGGTPNYDGTGKRDPKEQSTFDTICKFDGKQTLSPEHVYEVLGRAKGNMPVILTGVLYTSEIPAKSDKYAKENELGRGYLDLIQLGNGTPVNLADKNFGASLAKLGEFSQFRMDFENTFACRTSVPPMSIHAESLNISVSSEAGKTLGEFRTSCWENPDACPKGTHAAYPRIVTNKSGKPSYLEITLSPDHFQRIAKPGAKIQMSFTH